MERVNKQALISFFMHLCNDMNKAICLSKEDLKAVKKWGSEHWTEPCKVVPYGTVGAWRLDYAGCYGGWQIQEIDTPSGGISCPLGYRRYKTPQMLDMICFAREAIRLRHIQQKEAKSA